MYMYVIVEVCLSHVLILKLTIYPPGVRSQLPDRPPEAENATKPIIGFVD